ncbi:MAG: helix-turn-helix transcriptional regulator [Treponema sp.]|uniref:helix-turn-helix domain-containing protein n=1 Tax=Treponema sp. TaxID=166 RepID=UPI00298E99DE|nr:XRE family transcriptional regulator [Treponema sp.]MBR5933006.1 helix-turn-helix transcriptional regulator [Treponema sp.]
MTASQKNDPVENEVQDKRIPYHFGEKLRSVRERKGYTLKVVANQAGVSESLVSQIERNRVSPAIDTLLALADVLDINLEFLFEEYRRKHPVQVIRATNRRRSNDGSIVYEEVVKPDSSDGQNTVEAYTITIPAGEKTHRGSYGHLGRELGIILSGKCELHYEKYIYELKEGDSVSFSANAPHTIVNTGDKELKAMWVVSPAQRFVTK